MQISNENLPFLRLFAGAGRILDHGLGGLEQKEITEVLISCLCIAWWEATERLFSSSLFTIMFLEHTSIQEKRLVIVWLSEAAKQEFF